MARPSAGKGRDGQDGANQEQPEAPFAAQEGRNDQKREGDYRKQHTGVLKFELDLKRPKVESQVDDVRGSEHQ
jgi:hypothetical protein